MPMVTAEREPFEGCQGSQVVDGSYEEGCLPRRIISEVWDRNRWTTAYRIFHRL